MADKFDLSFDDCKWFIDAKWLLRIASPRVEDRGKFHDHGIVNEINSVSSGRLGDEKNVPLYKIVTVEVRDGQIMEANRVALRVSKCYTKAGGCNKDVLGCLAKGKALRETAGSFFLYIVIVYNGLTLLFLWNIAELRKELAAFRKKNPLVPGLEKEKKKKKTKKDKEKEKKEEEKQTETSTPAFGGVGGSGSFLDGVDMENLMSGPEQHIPVPKTSGTIVQSVFGHSDSSSQISAPSSGSKPPPTL
jgi:hypothetical protein